MQQNFLHCHYALMLSAMVKHNTPGKGFYKASQGESTQYFFCRALKNSNNMQTRRTATKCFLHGPTGWASSMSSLSRLAGQPALQNSSNTPTQLQSPLLWMKGRLQLWSFLEWQQNIQCSRAPSNGQKRSNHSRAPPLAKKEATTPDNQSYKISNSCQVSSG